MSDGRRYGTIRAVVMSSGISSIPPTVSLQTDGAVTAQWPRPARAGGAPTGRVAQATSRVHSDAIEGPPPTHSDAPPTVTPKRSISW